MLGAHVCRCRNETLMHRLVGEHAFDSGPEFLGFPVIAVQVAPMPRFRNALGVVMAIPDIGHDESGLTKVQAFIERVVAPVVDHRIGLRDDRGLGIP